MASAPTQSKYQLQRAMVERRAGMAGHAMDDLDQVLKLAPNDVEARLARAELFVAKRDNALARSDLDALDKAAASDAELRLRLAFAYGFAKAYDEGIRQLDQWIATHPKDDDMADALNGRCWFRGLSSQALDLALGDCSAALKLKPGDPDTLNSRALVRLRRGEVDKAIVDYQTSLALKPNDPWSLYGRGLAELKKGLKSEGDADLKAAAALKPTLPDEAKALGLTP